MILSCFGSILLTRLSMTSSLYEFLSKMLQTMLLLLITLEKSNQNNERQTEDKEKNEKSDTERSITDDANADRNIPSTESKI